MGINSRGSEFFFAPDGTTVLNFACPRGIQGIGINVETEEDQCLADAAPTSEVKSKKPNAITIPFRYEIDDASHQALIDLTDTDTLNADPIPYYIGLPDGTTDPTLTGGAFVAPTGRTGLYGVGVITGFSIDAQAGSKIQGTMTFQPNTMKPQKKTA